MEWIEGGGVTSAAGFRAGAAACGLKASGGLDVALVVADDPCSTAGVFTRNRVVAAPVVLSREALAAGRGRARAVVVNSGNANACTGTAGMDAARAMQRAVAVAIGCAEGEVLVLSTGVIGVPMEVGKVEAGIAAAGRAVGAGVEWAIGADSGAVGDGTSGAGSTTGVEGSAGGAIGDGVGIAGSGSAARAIMTTDTVPKAAAVRVALAGGDVVEGGHVLKGGDVVVGGMAKGAGMIHPDMATMLAVLTTDARIGVDALDRALRKAVDRTFNRITVDGDTSTNDAVVVLASGASGVDVASAADLDAFERALHAVCERLAKAIVRDGEGASRFVTIHVVGATSESDALMVARAIATSPLVKTAFAGGDPNWGRIVAAAGRSGVPVEPERMTLDIGAGESEADGPWLRLFERGMPADFDRVEADLIFGRESVRVQLRLGMGTAEAAVWTCDLTSRYVEINAEYRT